MSTCRRAAVAACVCAAAIHVPNAAGDPPARRVSDIAVGTVGRPPYPGIVRPPVRLGDHLVFPADDGVSGWEIWATDGTVAGTGRLVDVCPGRCWSMTFEPTVAGGRLFFEADDGVHGLELWAMDGVHDQPRLVADIVEGLGASRPRMLTAVGELLYFLAGDGIHGRELWSSDGTRDGTRLVVDLTPGPAGSFYEALIAVGERLVVFADDGIRGVEPYAISGNTLTPLGDLFPGPNGSFASNPTSFFSQYAVFADRLIFAAVDPDHGGELWVTDGTQEGTGLVADLVAGPGSSEPAVFVPAGERVYFSAETAAAGRELWRSDGTPGGTEIVADVVAGVESSRAFPLLAIGEDLFFAAFTEATGRELWTTRGDPASTHLVADIAPGSGGGLDFGFFAGVAPLGDRLVFFADDGVHGLEPWVSGGTEGTTHLLGDLLEGDGWSIQPFTSLSGMTPLDGQAVFFTLIPEEGLSLRITDGSSSGTRLLQILDTQTSSVVTFFGLHLTDFADVGGRVFSNAQDAVHGTALWLTRGSPGTTRLVRDVRPDGDVFLSGLLGLTDRALFTATPGDEPVVELWSSDGTEAGTVLLRTVDGLDFGERSGNLAYFPLFESGVGGELLATDGTDGGTEILDLLPGDRSVRSGSLTAVGDRLFFASATADSTLELWVLAGDGPRLLTELDSSPYPDLQLTTAVGDRLFFAADHEGSGLELWVSDGTPAGTGLVEELQEGPSSGVPRVSVSRRFPDPPQMVPVGESVYFVGDDGVTGQEIWRSDGTADGTTLVADLFPGPRGSEPRWLATTGDRMFFVAENGVHGRELWHAGPGVGAELVEDIVPGPESGRPSELLAVDGLLYFNAYRPDVGVELWVSDGTAEGTALLQDIWPGPESSTPEKPTVSGRRLYFTANDGEHGFEPWSLLLPTRLPRGRLHVEGEPRPGAAVTLVLEIHNPPPEPLVDGEGPELVLSLPSILIPVAVTASSGMAEIVVPVAGAAGGGTALEIPGATDRLGVGLTGATTDTPRLEWSGSLPPGETAIVRLEARISPQASAGTAVELQAYLSFDSDGDGLNDETLASDDEGLPGSEDPTRLAILPYAVEVPALSQLGLVALALLILAFARRRIAAASTES